MWFVFVLLLFGVAVIADVDYGGGDIVTRDLSKYTGYEITSAAVCTQEIWIPYEEGESFPGTNAYCQHLCQQQNCPGWSWTPPNPETALEYNDYSIYSLTGICRIYYPTEKPAFYLYSGGQKWSHTMVPPGGKCPDNSTQFAGIEKNVQDNELAFYKPASSPGSADICLLTGHITTACQGVPLRIRKSVQLVIVNETNIEEKGYYWCSNQRGGCGAHLPLFEKKTVGYQYSTQFESTEDGEWRQLCWVWSTENCRMNKKEL